MIRRKHISEHRVETALAELGDHVARLPNDVLTEMARTATASRPALDRPRRRRAAQLPLVAAAALGLVVLAGVPAWLLANVERGGQTDVAAPTAVATWGWRDLVPGKPVAADPLLDVAARESGVAPARVAKLLAHGSGRERVTLVAAADAGRVCFAVRAGRFVGDFLCPRRLDPEVLIQFSVDQVGRGPRAGVRLLGVARSDVGRVVLTLSDGTATTLALNRWRAFAYSSRPRSAPPRLLTVFGRGGALLTRIAFSGSQWVRVCGGPARPCLGEPDGAVELRAEPGLVL